MSVWRVHAVKYAGDTRRVRGTNFIFDEDPSALQPIDYFMWVIENGTRTILVDSGYDTAEAEARGRPIRLEPHHALAPLGIAPEAVDTLIVTHLHYDHAGGLHLFPNATLHIQAAEMTYANGQHWDLQWPIDGDAEIADGITVHCIGGHSRGLQVVRVRTEAGWMVLASDASHFYENIRRRQPFPIVVDVEAMLEGFKTLEHLASTPDLIIPGHDPIVRTAFPQGVDEHISRLDRGPVAPIAI